MFLDIREFREENKQKLLRKTVLVIWSQTYRKFNKISVRLLRKNSFKNLDLHWVNIGCYAIYKCFQTFESLEKKAKKIFRENCLEIVVSESYKKNQFCPQNPPKIVITFMVFSFYFSQFSLFLKVGLWTQSNFFTNMRQYFQNCFPIFFLFLIPKFLETCVNCVTKCVTAIFTPLKYKFQAFSIWVFKLNFCFSFQFFKIIQPLVLDGLLSEGLSTHRNL